MTIANTQTSGSEIVLSERKVTTEYRIVQIREDIFDRRVEVEVELGPFVTETIGPEDSGLTQVRGTGGRRGIQVWQGDEYESIRDSWTNADLIAAVAAKMA